MKRLHLKWFILMQINIYNKEIILPGVITKIKFLHDTEGFKQILFNDINNCFISWLLLSSKNLLILVQYN